jgi:cytochrome c oxidase cbb3-type subunit 3
MKFYKHKTLLNKAAIVFSAIILSGGTLFAQTASSTTAAAKPDFPESYYTILAIGFLTILIAIVMGFFIFGMGEGKEKPVVVKDSLVKKLLSKLSGSTPIEKEQDILLEHEYDGIKELDNKIPPWFSYLFYITIFFSVVYLLDYHVFGSGKVMQDEYNQEIKIAAIQRAELEKTGAFVNEATVSALIDAAEIGNGKKIFDANCVACHAAGGAGLVGPNLTDDYWIHGGGIKNIFKTIKYGVPAKGMISWQTQLNPKQIQEVSSYILSIHGTNPPNPKAPQGDKYIQNAPAAKDSVKTASL